MLVGGNDGVRPSWRNVETGLLMGESRLACLEALCVSSGQKSLAQQLGAELKVQIVKGIAKTIEAHRTH